MEPDDFDDKAEFWERRFCADQANIQHGARHGRHMKKVMCQIHDLHLNLGHEAATMDAICEIGSPLPKSTKDIIHGLVADGFVVETGRPGLPSLYHLDLDRVLAGCEREYPDECTPEGEPPPGLWAPEKVGPISVPSSAQQPNAATARDDSHTTGRTRR